MACLLVVGTVVIVVYVAAIPASHYLVEHSGEIAREIETGCDRVKTEAQEFARRLLNGELPVSEPEPLIDIYPPIPQPTQIQTQKERSPVVVQLQDGEVHVDSVPLEDSGNGVTTEQVVEALTFLRADPGIPSREQKGADNAYAKAVKWTITRPPYGVTAYVHKEFYFSEKQDWRFDIVVNTGTHLKK